MRIEDAAEPRTANSEPRTQALPLIVHQLLRHADDHRRELVELLVALVSAESPSTDKAAVDRLGVWLTERLTALGGRVDVLHRVDRGNHIRATFPGSAPGRPLMILGHFDTVWPVGRLQQMPIVERDGRLHGPGIYDMKGGIAAAMIAIGALRDLALSHPPVTMVLTSDEEIGSESSQEQIEKDARASRAVLVLEPSLPDGGVKTSRKGVGEFEVIAHGISAHAGIAPQSGANAVHEIAQQIIALHAFDDLGPGASVNVTVVSGGARSNVIPDEARAIVDVRVRTLDEARRVDERIRRLQARLPRTRLEIRGGIARPPLERSAGVAALYDVARAVALELGQDLSEGGTGGASDGNFTAALGVPTLDGLGPKGDGAHAAHEHVVLADLPWRAAFLAGLCCRLASPPWDNEVK